MENDTVQVYYHPNPEIRSYLTDHTLTKPRLESFASPLMEDPDNLITKLGIAGAQMVRDIMSIPGIAQIRVKPKEVRIRKVPHASWDVMEPEIFRIMNRTVRKSKMRVLKGKNN